MTAKTEKSAPSLSSLTGPEKVAVLLLALGKAKAAHILKRFDADELRLITRSAADLTTITAADLDALVEEFAKKFATGIKFIGTAKELENLLVAVMTEDEMAGVEHAIQKGYRLRDTPFMIGWVTDGLPPAALQRFFAFSGGPFRLLCAVVRRGYARREQRAFRHADLLGAALSP